MNMHIRIPRIQNSKLTTSIVLYRRGVSNNNINFLPYASMNLRMFNRINVFNATQQNNTPEPPTPPEPIIGTISFSYTYFGAQPLTTQLVTDNLPIVTQPGFIYTPIITISDPNVYVTLETTYEYTNYNEYINFLNTLGDIGFTFNNVRNFYTSNTSGLNIISSLNFPFSKSGYQFYTLSDIIINTNVIPLFLNNTSLERCFSGCGNFNSAIGHWDTSNVINMSSMFSTATIFNQNINYNPVTNTWNTTNVTNMSNMFFNALSFNQPIGNWDTSNVENMSYMFYNDKTGDFNRPIGNWNTSKVTDMSYMFYNGDGGIFNQPIGNWNTSKVENMSYMFYYCGIFDQPLGNWDTSKVTNMSNMFNAVTVFNQPIGNWNTSKVTDMSHMFDSASIFNQNISYDSDKNAWNTSKVTNLDYMFYVAYNFNNGQTPNVGITAPMKWIFNVAPSAIDWRTGSGLTNANKPSSLPP